MTPDLLLKAVVNHHNNYLHDKRAEDKDRFISIFYFIVSLFLTILASFFIKYLNWISILILANLLIGILILSARNYNKRSERFWKNRKEMKKTFKNVGLE